MGDTETKNKIVWGSSFFCKMTKSGWAFLLMPIGKNSVFHSKNATFIAEFWEKFRQKTKDFLRKKMGTKLLILPKFGPKKDFPQKSEKAIFLQSLMSNFMQKIRKIGWTELEKNPKMSIFASLTQIWAKIGTGKTNQKKFFWNVIFWSF